MTPNDDRSRPTTPATAPSTRGASINQAEELQSVPNLGAKSARTLVDVGITTVQELQDIGPGVAFLAVRQRI